MPRKESTAAVIVDSPARRRGPKPLLSVEQEMQLVQWVLTLQRAGQRVSRDDVIAQAQEMLRPDQETIVTQKLGMGWCNRFVARHPELSLRSGGAAIAQQNAPATNEEVTLKITLSDGMPPDAVDCQEAESLTKPETVMPSETIQNEAGEAPGPIKTRKYNRKHMEAAVAMYLAGRPMSEVTQRFPLLHQRTIRRRVLRVQRGEVDKRRGPRPLLEGEPEQELVAWILDMQSLGTKVTKKDILARANEQYRALSGAETGENRLKDGWLRRFKERHPVLSGRAPRQKGEDDSSTEEETLLSSGGDNDSSKCAQSTDVQQEVTPVSEVEEKREPSQKRPEAVWSGDPAASPKRQKTEAKTSAVHSPTTSRSVRSSDSTRRGSILPERRQSEKAESIEKLDAIMQSNHRLEAMQRQQLEMLQQLCASNKVMSSITGGKRNIGSASTD